ncbi:MAG: DUF2240 family protein [Euryarchaeota archaeon]|nr:DUF2240 family protein [Euryarchaeota archaeon]
MESESKIVLAFLFKRSGKNMLKESDIYLPLSLELGWFSSTQAQEFVKHALNEKLLIKKDDVVTPSFDVSAVDIPIGFQPSKHVSEQQHIPVKDQARKDKRSLIEQIVDNIVEKTGENKETIAVKISDMEKEKQIFSEVAALVVAREYDVDVDSFFERIEHIFFTENTK